MGILGLFLIGVLLGPTLFVFADRTDSWTEILAVMVTAGLTDPWVWCSLRVGGGLLAIGWLWLATTSFGQLAAWSPSWGAPSLFAALVILGPGLGVFFQWCVWSFSDPDAMKYRRPTSMCAVFGGVGLAVAVSCGILAVDFAADGRSAVDSGGGSSETAPAFPEDGTAETTPPVRPGTTSRPATTEFGAVDAALGLSRAERRRIQEGLTAAGFDPGAPDGLFGAGTRTAIREWQAARGASTTGYLNEADAQWLFAAARRGEEPVDEDGPGAPRVTVSTEPASRIELDGRDAGVTGGTGLLVINEVPPGRHLITASKDGYADTTEIVEVLRDRSEVVELSLTALPGRLTVTANVAGARLSIEDVGDHPLPVTGLEVPGGLHRVKVTRAGFEPFARDVEVRAGEVTSLEAKLEPVSSEELVLPLRRLFDAGHYQRAADGARAVLSARPDVGAAHLLLGLSLYELGQFDESVDPLYRAIRRGQQVVLDANHRHGGAGFRPGFCPGSIALSASQITFRSEDEPDHGFTVSPEGVTNVEISEMAGRYAFRVNTRVQDQGTDRRNFDFVHRGTSRQREKPDSPLIVVLACADCDASLRVQAILMDRVARAAR